ncbi:beta-N-acetylhexosaminidase [Paenibacillus odorifer]|uniref:beta-N-acetylhexosaminidase n=1 Tax=Paenibacillus odorifer TaxID=189426 RepID=UPI000BD8B84E|nr:beta-N-acetylhexosaminidase [Paenibacillus odorifer]OZQ77856.1 beta-N-acetylhexosaminidase [Paenibacillus odorifer]
MIRLTRHSLKPKISGTLFIIAAMVSLFLIAGCSNSSSNSQSEATDSPTSQSTPAPTTSLGPTPSAVSDPIALQVAEMSLEEKIGQMLLVGIDGTVLDEQAKKMITEDKIGGIILYKDNIKNLKGMISLINSMKKSNTGNPAPLFMSVDQEGGKVSRMPKEYATFPSNGTVGASNDAAAAEKMGKLLAREVRSAGFNMNFAPVLDINSNPDNPVIGDRSFGNAAGQVIQLGIAEMKGIESEGVVPVVKHFPGHGDTSVDSHLALPIVNKTAGQLAELEWLPFQAAIKEGTDAVMVAHILFPKLDPDKPASLSRTIIGEQLRDEMGYQGIVITDDLTMGAIMKNYDLAAAAVDTVNAGSDILLVAHGYDNEKRVMDSLLQNVKNGKIQETRIDESVYRILALKAKYNLSDEQIPVPDLTDLNKDINVWRQTIEK